VSETWPTGSPLYVAVQAALIYRKELRPVIQTGATAMDKLFNTTGDTKKGGEKSA